MSKWKTVKLGEVCDVRDGTHESPEYIDEGYPLITSKNLINGRIDLSTINYISENDYAKINLRSNVDNGDIIMPMIGTIGNPVIVEKSFDFAIKNVALIKFSLANDISNKYIVYLLKSTIFLNYIDKENRGGTQKFLSLKNIRDFSFPLPSLEEQKHIADILDKASNLIDLRKQQLEKMDLLVKSKFIDMFGDPVTNPKGWEVKKISDVCEINPRKTELGSVPDDLEVSFIPMASVSEKGDIRTNEIKKYSEVKTGFTYFHEGDVLFAKITPCMENGKGAIAVNLKNKIGFGSTEFHVIRPINNIATSEWIFNLLGFKWLRDDAEKNMTGSAGQRRVPTSYFERYKIAVPPIELQNQFAEFVEQVEKQKAVMQQSLEKMETNYKALMQEYFG